MFSQLPHYHATEATQYIKQVLGPYYQKDERNVFRAMWEETALTHVSPDVAGEKVYWFRSSSSSK